MPERYTYSLPSLFTFLGRHYLGIRNVINLLGKTKNVKVLDIGCGPLEPFTFTELLEKSHIRAVDLDEKNVELIRKIMTEGILLQDLSKVSCNFDPNGNSIENEEFNRHLAHNIADYETHSNRRLTDGRFKPLMRNNRVSPVCADIEETDFREIDVIYLGSVLQNVKKVWTAEKYLLLLKRIRKTAPNSVIAGSTFYTEIYGPGQFLKELANAGFDLPVLILEDVCTRARGNKEVLVADYTWIVTQKSTEIRFSIPRGIPARDRELPQDRFMNALSLEENILLCSRAKGKQVLFYETPLRPTRRRVFYNVQINSPTVNN